MLKSQGAFRYMPVASLSNPYHEIVIADEIESFFNVLLYQAVRRINHNFDDQVSRIVANYFLAHEYVDGMHKCGIYKRVLMRNGRKLELEYSRAALSFSGASNGHNTALDTLFKSMLA